MVQCCRPGSITLPQQNLVQLERLTAMAQCMNDEDTHSGSLHSFAVEALKSSRSRGRAQKGAPYAGLLLDCLVEDFRAGRSTYDLAHRGVRASLSERRQSPLLRTLHAMALRRLEALRVEG